MTEKTKNLCAQIPESLHAKVCQEKEKSGKALSQYMTDLLNEYYNGRSGNMNSGTKTLAFQISEELFQRLKDYLTAEQERTGRKISQKEFVVGLIEQALNDAEE